MNLLKQLHKTWKTIQLSKIEGGIETQISFIFFIWASDVDGCFPVAILDGHVSFQIFRWNIKLFQLVYIHPA